MTGKSAAAEDSHFYRAILQSMSEGVLVVGIDGKILDVNGTFCLHLGLDPAKMLGALVEEAVREPKVLFLIKEAAARGESVETDFEMEKNRRVFFHAYGNVIREKQGQVSAVLVVVNDVTRTKRLETIRRDFIANVSHELKTPITAIKGFIETLTSEVVEDRRQREEFLGIIARQAQRLYAIVEDLLRLSRIESDFEHSRINLEHLRMALVFEAALESCAAKIKEKEIVVDVQCPEGMHLTANGSLLEQAIVNLLDNAINYSEAKARITLQAETEGGEACINVIDEGCGIAEEYHSRIFERFFRVDKARSRKLGGTGLGLAIVKHIALAHQGRVGVESRPGQGSRFFIALPIKDCCRN